LHPGLVLTEADAGSTHVVAVTGELDLKTAPDLCRRLGAQRGRHVVVDLSELAFCDSCGLRALLGEARETAFEGGRLDVVAPTGTAVRRLLEVTGCLETLHVRDVRAAAPA
jgi:anti-sigma B factor antagonist